MAPLFQSLYLLSLGTLILIASFLLELMDLPPDKTVLQRGKIFPDTTEFLLWLNKKGHWRIFIFNTTNPHEVSFGVKPVLKETGPYVYEEIISKTNIQFNPRTDTVSYRTFAVQKFLRDLSNGSERDELFVPILRTADETASRRRAPSIPYNDQIVYNIYDQSEYFVKMRVRNLLAGTYVPLDTSSSLSYSVRPGPFQMHNHARRSNEIQVGSEDQQFKDIGRLVKWMGQPDLTAHSDHCNYIDGTDGTVFPPNVTRQAVLHVFLPYLRRSVYFKYTTDTVVNGIPAYRFDLAMEAFDDHGKKENNCYCRIYAHWLRCPLDSTFQHIMSLPHFLGDPNELKSQFGGLAPAPAQHESYIELETSSGLVLSAHYRFQLNVVLRFPAHDRFYRRVHTSRVRVYPVMWWDYQYSDLIDPVVKNAMLNIGTEPVSSSLGWYKWLIILFGFAVGSGGLIIFYFQVVNEQRTLK